MGRFTINQIGGTASRLADTGPESSQPIKQAVNGGE
jgi:hypothetical protein